jgi:hypothetical protein
VVFSQISNHLVKIIGGSFFAKGWHDRDAGKHKLGNIHIIGRNTLLKDKGGR